MVLRSRPMCVYISLCFIICLSNGKTQSSQTVHRVDSSSRYWVRGVADSCVSVFIIHLHVDCMHTGRTKQIQTYQITAIIHWKTFFFHFGGLEYKFINNKFSSWRTGMRFFCCRCCCSCACFHVTHTQIFALGYYNYVSIDINILMWIFFSLKWIESYRRDQCKALRMTTMLNMQKKQKSFWSISSSVRSTNGQVECVFSTSDEQGEN